MRRAKTRYLTIGGLLLIFVAVIAIYVAQAPPAGGAQIGRPAPEFAVSGLSGGSLALSDYRGRPVVINFFASWCGPCWREMPDLDDAADKYRDSTEAISRMANHLGLTFPIGLDPSGKVAADQYRIRGLPVTVFVDRQEVVRKIWTGPIARASLERAIEGIL